MTGRIDVLLTKDCGEHTAAKLDAAGDLDPVVVIARPAKRVPRVSTVDEAVAWLARGAH